MCRRRAALAALGLAFLVAFCAHGQAPLNYSIRERTRDLYSNDANRRSSAAASLLATYDEDALKALFKAMAPDQREEVRLSVITAFEVMRDDRGVPRLIDALEDKSETIRQAAASALLKACSTPKAIRLLEAAAADDKRPIQTRSKAIGILGEMRSMDSIPTLIRILADEDASLRKASNDALERITLRSFPTVKEWEEWWERSQQMTRVKMLEEYVRRQADQIRAMARRMEELELQVLKNEKIAKDAPALLKFLVESDSRKVKLQVLDLLVSGEHKGEAVVAALTEAFDDPNADVRQKCVEVLGRQQDPESAPQLLKMLDDPAPEVQAAAARALGDIRSTEAVDALCRLLPSPSEKAATAAAVALGQIGDHKAVEPLMAVVSKTSTPTLLKEAANALGKIKDLKVVPALRKLLSSDNRERRWAAVDVLGALQATDAVADIAEVARKDEEPLIRERALAALARIGDSGAVDAVVAALSDPVERVAAQAFRSLTTLAEADPRLYLTAIDQLSARRQFDLAEKVVAQALDGNAANPNHAKETAQLRARIAKSLMEAKEYARARPYLEALVTANPASAENAKELLQCLKALPVPDRPAQAALLAQARPRFPKDVFWWNETVRLAEELMAQGKAKEVLALIADLEKENPKLGGEKTAAALRELKAKAEAALDTPEKPSPEPPPA